MPLAGKLTLLGLWLVSVIGLGVIGIREATEHSFSGKVTTEERLDITKGDTLRVAMRTSEAYDIPIGRSNNSVMRIDASGERTYVNRNVRLIVRETQDATGYFKVVKEADGSTFNAAKEEAGYIDYSYEVTAGNLNLDGFFTSSRGKRYRDQEVEVILYLPEGAYLYADDNTYSYHRNSSSYRDILDNGTEEKYLLLEDGEFICDDCGSKSRESSSWERDNEGEWQYDSYEEGNKPDWENTSAATQLIITNDEVRLSIGTLTTRNELDTIKQQLKRDKNIDMSYSGSEFTPRGRIKKLSLEIDCNDGYSGKTINWAKSLDSNSIGFKRDYTLDAAEPFIIGEL
jgi:hypothetical protein